jgi:hypothetical protein
MYTIHALVNSKCVPLVYSFLPRKTQVIYEKFLQIIAEKLSKVPKSLTIDFELAFLNACMIIFPGVPMYLCFFHFSLRDYVESKILIYTMLRAIKKQVLLKEF